jgi:5-methylcytosine-specific restriction protein A
MPKVTTLPPRFACAQTGIASPLPTALNFGDRSRASAHARGYGWAWKKKRARVLLRDQYRCQECKRCDRLTAAAEVDHIVNKARWMRERGTLDGVDDEVNLQSLCSPCHSEKTQQEAAEPW